MTLYRTFRHSIGAAGSASNKLRQCRSDQDVLFAFLWQTAARTRSRDCYVSSKRKQEAHTLPSALAKLMRSMLGRIFRLLPLLAGAGTELAELSAIREEAQKQRFMTRKMVDSLFLSLHRSFSPVRPIVSQYICWPYRNGDRMLEIVATRFFSSKPILAKDPNGQVRWQAVLLTTARIDRSPVTANCSFQRFGEVH